MILRGAHCVSILKMNTSGHLLCVPALGAEVPNDVVHKRAKICTSKEIISHSYCLQIASFWWHMVASVSLFTKSFCMVFGRNAFFSSCAFLFYFTAFEKGTK